MGGPVWSNDIRDNPQGIDEDPVPLDDLDDVPVIGRPVDHSVKLFVVLEACGEIAASLCFLVGVQYDVQGEQIGLPRAVLDRSRNQTSVSPEDPLLRGAMGLGDKVRLWIQNVQHTHVNQFHKKLPKTAPLAESPDVQAIRVAVIDLIETFGDEYPGGSEYLARLAALEAADRDSDPSVPVKLKALRREALLANPLMDFDKLILLKRKRGQLGLPTNHQCNACLDQFSYDNELAILSPVRPDGRLRTLFRPSNGAYVGEMDLHFEADRLLFAMPNGRTWQIHEIRIDGSGLRQISRRQESVDNFDACYLPVSIPRHFWMSVCEITNEQFRRFDPSHHPGLFSKRPAYDDPGMMAWLDGSKQPVVRVSWEQAVGFCEWLSEKTGMPFGLPTEARWEYACRAGSSADFYFGDLGDDFSGYGNFADKAISPRSIMTTGGLMMQDIPSDTRYDDRAVATAKVGSYQPNAWDLYDMHGNVAEWTLSTYKPYPYRDGDRNSLEPHGRKVVRGGSFYDRPKRCRSAFRLSYPAWQRVHSVGFRMVSEINP